MVKVLILGLTLQERVTETELDLEVEGPVAINALIEGNAELLDGFAPFVVRGELLVTIELTIRAVTTPMKQARAKKRMANWVLVEIFIVHKLPEIKEKVNRKKLLAIRMFFW